MAGKSLTISITKNSSLATKPLHDLQNNQITKELIMENFLRPGTYYTSWDGILVRILIIK